MSLNTAFVTTRAENMALMFQEVLTAIVRVRSNRQQSPDAETFRYHVREAVRTAAQNARSKGYGDGDVKLATLAVVALLDESVLSSKDEVFANWSRQTLGQEFFGSHEAGYVFFDNITQLLGSDASAEVADVLEVYYLCLLLGYTGRYSGGTLQEKRQAIAGKINRIRGTSGDLAFGGAAPQDSVAAPRKESTRTLMVATVACIAVTLILYAIFRVSLASGISDLQVLAGGKV